MATRIMIITIYLYFTVIYFSVSQSAKICIPNKTLILPLRFDNGIDIDTSNLKRNYLYVTDSLSKIYFIDSDSKTASPYCECCIKVVSTIVSNEKNRIQDKFKYALTIKVVNSTFGDDIMKIDLFFKDLHQLIESKTELSKLFLDTYQIVFEIFGDKGVFEDEIKVPNFSLIVKEEPKIDSLLKYQNIASILLNSVISIKNKPSTRITRSISNSNKVFITPIVRLKDQGVLFKFLVESDNYVNFVDENGIEIKSEFFIENKYIEKSDYSLLYGKMNSFVYRLIKSNF